MLFAGLVVGRVKNEVLKRPTKPQASPRSQFFTIRSDAKLVNNLYIILSLPKIIVIKRKKALPWAKMGKLILR